MVPLMSLWLPIVLAAVFVFVASSVLHMVLPFHKNDWRRVPREDQAMEALRAVGLPPGDYMIPCPAGMQDSRSPEFIAKLTNGPVAVMTVMRSGPPSMGANLAQWFVYCVVVGIFAGYITGRALPVGAHYLQVFRFAGCTAFVGYSLALWQNTIWYKRAWTATLRSTIDGLLYGLLTAGVFGWLWPR